MDLLAIILLNIYLNTDWDIIIIDKLSYASKGFERLRDIKKLNNKRIRIFCYDLINSLSDGLKYEFGNDIDYIVHMAAETHIDNSIKNPVDFIHNNVMSTINILEYGRTLKNLKNYSILVQMKYLVRH